MSGFFTALIKQRKEAKKAGPDIRGRFNEIYGIVQKYDYANGITPEIVVGILQDLGPTFVKIGQIASQQSDGIPAEYCDALAKLRSSVAPMDMQTVHAQIKKHLGKPVDELFTSFDDKPLGSASIGQVHRAELPDGTVVAVKVRRPGVVDTVARDFALLESIIDRFAKNGIGGIDIKSLIVELEKTSKIELDFTNEAANLEKFWANNEERPVESPKCYREYTNEAILTEDFITGHEVGDIEYIDALDDDERDRIAALIADNFASQVLLDGFYHADPHSGNVLIKEPAPKEPDAEDAPAEGVADVSAEVAEEAPSEDGAAAAEEASADDKLPLPEHGVEWIDFGMMGILTAQQRQILLDLVTSIVIQDAYSLKRTVLKAAQPQGDIDHGALLEMCEGMCSQYTGSDFGDFDLGELLGSVVGGLQDESYKIDPFLTNLSRGIIAVEGTIKTLSSRVNILNYFIDKADIGLGFDIDFNNLDDEQLEELKGPLAMELMKYLESASRSSAKTAEALDMLEKGQIQSRTNFGLEEKALGTIERITEYAIRGLLVFVLFLGSCLLCMAPPATMEMTNVRIDFPAIGLVGYMIAVVLAIFLYRDVKKRK